MQILQWVHLSFILCLDHLHMDLDQSGDLVAHSLLPDAVALLCGSKQSAYFEKKNHTERSCYGVKLSQLHHKMYSPNVEVVRADRKMDHSLLMGRSVLIQAYEFYDQIQHPHMLIKPFRTVQAPNNVHLIKCMVHMHLAMHNKQVQNQKQLFSDEASYLNMHGVLGDEVGQRYLMLQNGKFLWVKHHLDHYGALVLQDRLEMLVYQQIEDVIQAHLVPKLYELYGDHVAEQMLKNLMLDPDVHHDSNVPYVGQEQSDLLHKLVKKQAHSAASVIGKLFEDELRREHVSEAAGYPEAVTNKPGCEPALVA